MSSSAGSSSRNARTNDQSHAELVRLTEELAREKLGADPTGHDWWHTHRVRTIGLRIARQENANPFVVEVAALLHDIEDYKFSGSVEAGPRFATDWLESLKVEAGVISAVSQIIRDVSFHGAHVVRPELSIEGKCVQDADRLDAIGAIGIARAFAYGGFVHRPLHDPTVQPVLHTSAESYQNSIGTTINHFHEKLLLLKARMNTHTGGEIAERRHAYLLSFLAEFECEWMSVD